MSTSNAVRSRIAAADGDRLWTLADFPNVNKAAAAAALSRLFRAGELRRIRKGVYYRPKRTVVGESKPDPERVVAALLRRTGANAVRTGQMEFNRLGLTNQLSNAITLAADRPIHTAVGRGIRVSAVVRPLLKSHNVKPEERAALDALRRINRIPDATPSDVLSRLKTLLRTGVLRYERLANLARLEPARVRALVGALGEDLLARSDATSKEAIRRSTATLHRSLNPLSVYRVPGADQALTNTHEWRIR